MTSEDWECPVPLEISAYEAGSFYQQWLKWFIHLFLDVHIRTLAVLWFAGALLAAEHVKGSVTVSVEEGKNTRLHVSEYVTSFYPLPSCHSVVRMCSWHYVGFPMVSFHCSVSFSSVTATPSVDTWLGLLQLLASMDPIPWSRRR